MACNLTLGRLEPCKDKVGGLKAVYFVNFEPLTVTRASGDDHVTDLQNAANDADITGLKYDLRGTNSLENTINASRENGTVFFDQTLSLQLKGLTKETHKEVKLMAYGRPHIIVEDNNGLYWLMGEEHGCEVTGGTIVTGSAMGDLYGYTLTFTAQEKLPACNIAVDDLSSIITITEGT